MRRQDVREGNVQVRRWRGTRGCGFSTSDRVARAGLALKAAVVQTGRHWVVHSLEGTAGVKAFVGGGSPRVEETAGGCAAAAEQAQRKVGRR